jgi:hypothetical protein
LEPEKLGQTPLTDRQKTNDFKEKVDAKTDPTLGQAALDVSKASRLEAVEQLLRKDDVQDNIEKGEKDTKGFW